VWFQENIIRKLMLDAVVNFGGVRLARILESLDNIDMLAEKPEY
jgi:hypothetical protein